MDKQRKDQPIEVSKNVFKEWLEKLQQESWQLELLISGFAIFGIYAARPFINELDIKQDLLFTDTLGFVTSIVITILKKGWMIFFINLLVHVVLRGLWIGAIGLRYVSSDIDYDAFNYSAVFKEYLKNKVGSYDDFIERLEKLCSVIFAFTFLLFLFFFSLMIFFLEFMLILFVGVELFGQDSVFVILIWMLFICFGLLVFVDFVSAGGLKKIKDRSFSKFYYLLFRFYSFITFSYLYRPLLYNFIDNRYTKRLFYLSIPYIFLVLFGASIFDHNPHPYVPDTASMASAGLYIDDYNYDDLRLKYLNEFVNDDRKTAKRAVPTFSMEAFYVDKEVTSCFIRLHKNMSEIIRAEGEIQPYYKEAISFKINGQNLHEDEAILDLNKKKSADVRDLYTQARSVRKQIREGDDSPTNRLMLDSLELLIQMRETMWNDSIAAVRRSKAEKSLSSYTDLFDLKIDGAPANVLACFYHEHPNFREMGIKCFIGLDSLGFGMHTLTCDKKYMSRDSVRSRTYTLPFLVTDR